MKKKLTAFSAILFLVGCNSKKIDKITCTKTISDEISSITYEEEITYEDDVLISVQNNMNLSFNDKGKDHLELYKTYAESSKNEYNKKPGVEAKLENDDNSIILNVHYDVTNMSQFEIENNSFDKSLNDLKEIKTTDGYTCK